MNIVKQIKLYRAVKDYLLKNPLNVNMSSKMYGTYGDLTTFYEINMGDISLTTYAESNLLGAQEYWFAVRDKQVNDVSCGGLMAKSLYKLLRSTYNQRFQGTTRFGIGR